MAMQRILGLKSKIYPVCKINWMVGFLRTFYVMVLGSSYSQPQYIVLF